MIEALFITSILITIIILRAFLHIEYAAAHWLVSRVKNIANYFAYVSLDPWVKTFLGNPNKKKKSRGGWNLLEVITEAHGTGDKA